LLRVNNKAAGVRAYRAHCGRAVIALKGYSSLLRSLIFQAVSEIQFRNREIWKSANLDRDPDQNTRRMAVSHTHQERSFRSAFYERRPDEFGCRNRKLM
jgi:hypothetical protein